MSITTYNQLKKEEITALKKRVNEKTLPDLMLFTATPLESIIPLPEGADNIVIITITAQNEAINTRNAQLCKTAKTLKSIIGEASITP